MLVKDSINHNSKRSAFRRGSLLPRGVFGYHPVVVDGGLNARLSGVDGKSYIDFAGGIGAMNVGHSHPSVVAAVQRQASQLQHVSIHVASYPGYLKVCEHLIETAPGNFAKKALLLNSGAEAVENAVKLARAYTGRPGVISFEWGFHGRTYLAVTLTGKERPYRQKYGPFPGGIYHSVYPYIYRPPKGVAPAELTSHCLDRLEKLLQSTVAAEQVAAIIIEPVLGEGGFLVPPADFIPALRRLCDKHGILLIADEVQTGFGRTGTLFAMEQSGVVPDLTITAKSLAAGFPLSAVVGRADVMDSVEPGGVGGTYGGNPVSCAAAMAVFDIFARERLLERSKKVGRIIQKRFDAMARRLAVVGDSRGLGAMRALELVSNKKTKEPLGEAAMKNILSECASRGLLVIKAGAYGNVIRNLVPLTVPFSDLDQGLDILEGVLGEVRP